MDLTAYIRDVPDFPKPGVVFKDITPLLADPKAFAFACARLAAHYATRRVDAIAAADEYTKHRADGVRNVYYAETNVRAPREGEGAWEYVRKLISAPFMGAINQMTQEIAGSNLNHMSQMKSFGDTIVGTGEAMLVTLASATGVANSLAAKATLGVGFVR